MCTLGWATIAAGQDVTVCGPIQTGGYGPFDYRTATAYQKRLVEGAHFPREVETLQRGHRGSLGGDIDYTLRAFPNHPRALLAMVRLGEKTKRQMPQGASWPVECYFERAIRFTPDDPAVRVVFAHYLLERGDKEGARKQLELVEGKVDNDANLSYNAGLAYFDLKDYARAREHAKHAYALGFPLDGLKKKLKQVKQWED
jgi:uncharacterized protein (TIGR02996 family)